MSLIPLTSPMFVSLTLIDRHLLERFERAGIKTLTDLSLYSPLELSLKFRLSSMHAQELFERLFSTLHIRSQTAYGMLLETADSYLPTRLPSLNRYLNGGLRRGSLVELCGSWGSGKTQFCLHLTAQCCLRGLRSIYIDTEHTFSSIRLLTMLNNTGSGQEHLLELVRTEMAFDCESLMSLLALLENEFEEEQKTNPADPSPVLLIVDSIAAPLRMSTAAFSREHSLLLFTDCAKRLATRYNLLVLVTNQVTTKRRSHVLSEKNDLASTAHQNSGNDFYMSVALGKAWSYSVNVRLAISYQGDTRRQLVVGKSIESPGYAIPFRIFADGIEEVEDVSVNRTHQRQSDKRPTAKLIQADEMHLIGKQLRP